MEKGLETTTMLDIASEADIIRMTLYRYFSNKDEIALDIYACMLGRIAALLALQMQKSSSGTWLRTTTL